MQNAANAGPAQLTAHPLWRPNYMATTRNRKYRFQLKL
jgi:hypothetical protein